MKLFHTENGKEVVYVQMQDIIYLNQRDLPIPVSIYLKVFKGVTIVNDSNRFDFVRFDEENEVSFFRSLEFVIDYDKYKDLTDEQKKKTKHWSSGETWKSWIYFEFLKWNLCSKAFQEKNAFSWVCAGVKDKKLKKDKDVK